MREKKNDLFMEYSRMVGEVMDMESAKEVLRKMAAETGLSSDDKDFLEEMLAHELLSATLGEVDLEELWEYGKSIMN